MIKEREFNIRKREDGIIIIKIWSTKWDEEGALEFVKELSKFLNEEPGKVKILTDATEAKFGPTRNARIIYQKLFKSPKIGKSAVFGLSAANKAIISFMLTATGKKDLKIFSTEEEALK